MVMMIPLVGGYLRILSGKIRGLSINETTKKVVLLLLLAMIGIYINEALYIGSFMYMMCGVLGGVLCGLYVFLTIGNSM